MPTNLVNDKQILKDEATDVIEYASADLTLRGLRAIYLWNRKTDD